MSGKGSGEVLSEQGGAVQIISDEEKNEINQLIVKRDEYREQKNFEQADKIRDQIMEKNIIFIDHKNSTRWIKQEKIKAN